MSPASVIAGLRRRWWLVLAVLVIIGFFGWVTRGIFDVAAERQASRAAILKSANDARDLAQQIKDQNAVILRVATAIDNATSQEARDRQSAALAITIDDLRRSIDCSALYAAGERPPPCAEVDARLDDLRSGVDPFARPTPSPTGAPT